MQKFKVTGMNCAACSARVEKAVLGVDGVTECNVNLLTGDMTVNDSADKEKIINAVINAGYGIEQAKYENKPKEKQTFSKTSVRLIISCILLVVLMYFSMFVTMHGAHLPYVLLKGNTYLKQGIIQFVLTTVIMVINRQFFVNGFKGIVNLAPNMDTLVSMGSLAAYGYSTAILIKMTSSDIQVCKEMLHGLYFESAAMILTLITVGKLLENYAKGKTTNAIKSLLELAPKTVTILRDQQQVTVNADEVLKNDVFVVLPGESFAVDGIVLEGASAVDESSLTGESVPIDKFENSHVFSGTINKTGKLICRATAVGEDSTLAKLVKMVSDAASSKAPIARIADKVSAIFVPCILAVALITFIVWTAVGKEIGFAIARAIAVLVISCPCALGLATPVAIMVGSGVGAKRGILFKTASALELCGKCDIVVFDKTGTITEGKPIVTDVLPLGNATAERLLQIAYALESGSAHPLAVAVNEYAKANNVELLAVSDFCERAGFGVSGKIDTKVCFGCSVASAIDNGVDVKGVLDAANRLSSDGKTPLVFVEDNTVIGVIAVADKIKDDAKLAVEALNKMKIKTIMLTGDNQTTAMAVANAVGINNVKSGVKPDAKATTIKELKSHGRVVMIGDGINDAVALTTADVGIAIGNGMDIAIESADVVLTNSKLFDVVDAISLSKKTVTNIKQNLFWAFIYNTIGIPLAAGVFTVWLGWQLNPMFAAAAMSLSSFCVVTNALRLNFFKGYKTKEKKVKSMKKTIKIEGLMCPHCEAHAKTALENIGDVKVLDISHKTGVATVEIGADVSDSALKNAVESQGYKVINIE